MKSTYSNEYFHELSKKCEEIQSEYKFKIPEYILTEIIENYDDKKSLCLLINMAVLGGSLKEYEGKILKKQFCFI